MLKKWLKYLHLYKKRLLVFLSRLLAVFTVHKQIDRSKYATEIQVTPFKYFCPIPLLFINMSFAFAFMLMI